MNCGIDEHEFVACTRGQSTTLRTMFKALFRDSQELAMCVRCGIVHYATREGMSYLALSRDDWQRFARKKE